MVTKKKKISEGPQFERSSELKRLFNELSEAWRRAHRLDLVDLAERCGVSLQYLSHIGRYGRVPGKPILTLLALNLSPQSPEIFFRAAGIRDVWPYEPGVALRARSASDSGLLTVNLDMHGFANAIRDIVRAEIQPKRIENLLGKRPLRVGLNRGQFFLFAKDGAGSEEGFFSELMRALVLSLRCELEFIDIHHAEFDMHLSEGKIDCYGPIYRTAPRIGRGLFTRPFCQVPASFIGRKRKAAKLEQLPPPRHFADLRKRDYVIAVHRESMAHHLVLTELGIPASRIIPCDTAEEAVERIVLSSLPRPAHLMIIDSPLAAKIEAEHPTTTELLVFNTSGAVPQFEDTIAVRSDWPELVTFLDESLEYLGSSGAIGRIFERTLPEYSRLGLNFVS